MSVGALPSSMTHLSSSLLFPEDHDRAHDGSPDEDDRGPSTESTKSDTGVFLRGKVDGGWPRQEVLGSDDTENFAEETNPNLGHYRFCVSNLNPNPWGFRVLRVTDDEGFRPQSCSPSLQSGSTRFSPNLPSKPSTLRGGTGKVGQRTGRGRNGPELGPTSHGSTTLRSFDWNEVWPCVYFTLGTQVDGRFGVPTEEVVTESGGVVVYGVRKKVVRMRIRCLSTS